MEFRMPSYYKNFRCIADRCPDTCCAGWAIVIDDRTLKKYANMQGLKGDYVRRHVDFKERVYKREGARCTFFNSSGLCDLHGRVGEGYLCRTCARYPRHFEEYGNLVEGMLTMSCPVAASLIINRKETDKFRVRHTDKRSAHNREVDSHLLKALVKVRTQIFAMTGNREYSIYNRMWRLLSYGADVQELVFDYEKLGLRRYIRAFRQETLGCIPALSLQFASGQDIVSFGLHEVHDMTRPHRQLDSYDILARRTRIKQYMQMLLGMENIDAGWPVLVKDASRCLYEEIDILRYEEAVKAFAAYMRDREYEYEHVLNYFIYTYYLGGVYNYNVQGMVKLAVVSTMIIWELGLCHWLTHGHVFTVEDQIVLCYRYSRQVEHSEDNLSSLEGLLTAHPLFHERELQRVLAPVMVVETE